MEYKLIQVKENMTVTTSLLVAEKFNKNHKDVLRKIEALISEIETGAILRPSDLYQKSEYTDSKGERRPMYLMNRDGFTLLAMGFSGSEALEWKLKYIKAFNEMEQCIHTPPVDNRLEIAKLIANAPESRVNSIRELYSEYFSFTSEVGSLEYISDLNTSYLKWKEDYSITLEWIENFPTIDIYNNYIRYCTENLYVSMGKKVFYHTLETDFGLTKKQRSDGLRYFTPM